MTLKSQINQIDNQTVSMTEELQIGGKQIVWLDKKNHIDPKDIAEALVSEEKQYASTIKAETRRFEFERSRYILHKMTNLNHVFLPDDMHVPVWPPHIVGSITHKNGNVAVSCLSSGAFLSVGIDCESASRDISHLAEKICTPDDLTFLDNLVASEKLNLSAMTSLLFSAKEALFKCHHPLGRKMFWFQDAKIIDFNLEHSWLDLRVLINTSVYSPAGHITRVFFGKKSASDDEYWLTHCTLTG